jgi:5'-3' exonuclease
MPRTFLLVDLANTFYRARHSTHRAQSAEEKVGMALHITLSSVAKCWRLFKADHVCFFLEGRSWRRDLYPPYKRKRIESRAAATPAQQAEDQLFWEASDALALFLQDRTNCTVLQHPQLEADDLIAGWVQQHTADQHVIISSDSDYAQLLAPNVRQYNGITDELISLEGIFDSKGNPVRNRKTGLAEPAPDPAWLLFEKCMRGDVTDNVFSAYPGVRTRGTKNKVGLIEAFADRHTRGWAWNNLMLQTFCDHNNTMHTVKDDYERNRRLIDLSYQPDEIRKIINDTVCSAVKKDNSLIGAQFLKFCGKYDLKKLSDNAAFWGQILSAGLEDKL